MLCGYSRRKKIVFPSFPVVRISLSRNSECFPGVFLTVGLPDRCRIVRKVLGGKSRNERSFFFVGGSLPSVEEAPHAKKRATGKSVMIRVSVCVSLPVRPSAIIVLSA